MVINCNLSIASVKMPYDISFGMGSFLEKVL